MQPIKMFFNITLLLSTSIFLNGCYLIKQGVQLIRYNSHAESVDHLLKDPNTEEKIRTFLKLAQEIRIYAADSIGLISNRNYTRMVEVDRSYIAVFVSAAEKLSFSQYKWCFPILGCIPYKGYFEVDDAKKEAQKLSDAGYDVNISEVDAFSTLGFFSDPLYNYMADYKVYSLASLIIHEQTHATLYLKNQTQFNEELATYIGNKGALAFIKSKYGENSDIFKSAVSAENDQNAYRTIMKELVNDLDLMYKGNESAEEKFSKKQYIIDKFRIDVKSNYDKIFKTSGYKSIISMPVNNASLAVWMTYTFDLALYEELFRKNGNNFRATIEFVKKLKKCKEDPKKYIRCYLQGKHNPECGLY